MKRLIHSLAERRDDQISQEFLYKALAEYCSNLQEFASLQTHSQASQMMIQNVDRMAGRIIERWRTRDRSATLSYITNTIAGELPSDRMRRIEREINQVFKEDDDNQPGQTGLETGTDSEPGLALPNDSAFDDDCRDEMRVPFTLVKPFLIENQAYGRLRLALRRFIGQPPMDVIRQEVYSNLKRERDGIHTVYFRVFWKLATYVDQEFDERPPLSAVFTVTGGTVDAYGATCEQYMKWLWKNSKYDLPHALEIFLRSQSFSK